MMQGILSPSSTGNGAVNSTFERRIIVLWVLVSVAAYTLDFVLISAVGSAVASLSCLTLVLSMAAPALAEWLVLRQYLPKLPWPRWLAATTIGSMLGAFSVGLCALLLLWLAGLLFPGPSLSFSTLFGQGTSSLALIVLTWIAAIGGTVVAAIYRWRTLTRFLSSEVLSFKSWWILAGAGAGFITGFALLVPQGMFASGLGNTMIRFMLGVSVTAASSFLTGVVLARLLATDILPPGNPTAGGGYMQNTGYGHVYRVPRGW
jgi:hypothetical protein